MTIDHEAAVQINIVLAVIFIAGLFIGTLATILRAVRLKVLHKQLPALLKRDLVSRGFLTLPIAAVMIARAANITNLTDNLLWILPTGVLWIASVWTYAYFEVFVIERPRAYSPTRRAGDR